MFHFLIVVFNQIPAFANMNTWIISPFLYLKLDQIITKSKWNSVFLGILVASKILSPETLFFKDYSLNA